MYSSSVALSILASALLTTAYPSNNTPSYQPRPYTIDVSPSFIEETRLKAATFRPTVDISAPAWFDGPPTTNITALAKYWAEEYNWFSDQDQINANFSHFMTTVPPPGGKYNLPLDIHFIHQRSTRTDAIPILLLHGWPSTSLEWERIIPDLINPSNSSIPAFHIIAPDLPGFGFSPAPTTPGLGAEEHSTVFASLMSQLGYSRYAIYSTDLGMVVALKMVIHYEERIINHISDMLLVFPNTTDLERYAANDTTAEETAYISSNTAFLANHSAYSAIHTTFPLSLAYALNDSPIGFLAWMFQLVYSGSDQVYSKAELVRQAFLLYLPGVYGNIRAYKELFALPNFMQERLNTVPTSALQFGGFGNTAYPELVGFNFVPRDWIERYSNVTYFARHSRGGHFPALSTPDLVVREIRKIFS